MNLRLTNYGHRLAQNLSSFTLVQGVQEQFLRSLLEHVLAPMPEDPSLPAEEILARLLSEGLIELNTESLTAEQTAFLYRRNPLEHLRRVVFEYTTQCNFACLHCRNGAKEMATEGSPEVLVRVAEALLRIGIVDFAFIGGEVSRYGDGWLDVAEQTRKRGAKIVAVLTNGWWLLRDRFDACGVSYDSPLSYLLALRDRGVTQVVFSVDGPEPVHDAWRRHEGLFQAILSGLELTKTAGLSPRVSVVIRPGEDAFAEAQFLADLAGRIYDLPQNASLADRANTLVRDSSNYVSHLIDIGNAATMSKRRLPLRSIPPALLRCKSFFRPSPSIRIAATGEVSFCPLLDAAEGYGNVHRESIVQILNSMQDRPVYRLHAEGSIAEFLPLVDEAVFGKGIDHVCTLRVIATLLARRIIEEGVDRGDLARVRRLNLEIARRTGHLRSESLDAPGKE